jgi:hypothetical protein
VLSPVTSLDALLREAMRAGKAERITFRDPIAGYGGAAVEAMRPWLLEPDRGAFAVRVLEKVAETPADRRLAIAALESVDRSLLSPAVAGDVADALERLGTRVGAGGSRAQAEPAPWAGYATAPDVERRFHDAMLDIFKLAGEATRKRRPDGKIERGYWASYFLRAVRKHGGVAYAHQLLRMEGTTEGFTRLQAEGRLDLTMEALVLRPQYAGLFSEHERQIASSRLARAGYRPGAD